MTLTIHNRCTITQLGDTTVCREHSVPVYYDGTDWHTDLTPEK